MKQIWILDFCGGTTMRVHLSEEKAKELESIDVEEFISKYEDYLGIRTKDCSYMVTDEPFAFEEKYLEEFFYKDLSIDQKINYKSWGIIDYNRKPRFGFFCVLVDESKEFGLSAKRYYNKQTCGHSDLYFSMPYRNRVARRNK